MAEILGVVGSAISILQLVEQTIQIINRVRALRAFMATVSDDLEEFLDDIEIVEKVLMTLTPEMLQVLSLPLIERRLHRFQADLTVLASVIQSERDRVASKRLERFKLFLKKDRLQKHRESLENIRHTLLLLQQTYFSARIQSLRLIEDSATKTELNTTTLQASIGCQEQEYNTRRPKDQGQRMSPRNTQGTKILSFRTPLLFVDKFWNINITGITSGWDFSIRSYNVIAEDSAVFKHCRDGNIEDIQRLFDNRIASPFDCEEGGWTLLHEAAFYGQLEVCKFLLQNGADPTARGWGEFPLETSNSNRSLWVPEAHNPDWTIGLYRLLLRDNEDALLEKPDSTRLGDFEFRGPPEALSLIQESLFVNYSSLPIEFRFRRAMSLQNWFSGGPSPDLLLTAMGGGSIDTAAYRLTDEDGKTLLFKLAGFMAGNFTAYFRKDNISAWRELIREAIQAGADLCQISGQYAWYGIYRSTPLMEFVFSHKLAVWGTKRAICEINHILQRWALELQSAGVDLAVYGAKESALWKSGAVDTFFHVSWHSHYSGTRRGLRLEEWLRVHLFSLSYGPNPEDWHVWFANPMDELVGEFWEMIERKEEIMPGAWVE